RLLGGRPGDHWHSPARPRRRCTGSAPTPGIETKMKCGRGASAARRAWNISKVIVMRGLHDAIDLELPEPQAAPGRMGRPPVFVAYGAGAASRGQAYLL